MDANNEILNLLKKIKKDMMHVRLFCSPTLNNFRNACVFAESDIEEFLMKYNIETNEGTEK